MLLALALLAAPVAAADGVIAKSASPDYPVGSMVATGQVLKLPSGQTVTVLDRSGAMVVRSAGAYAGPAERAAAGLAEVAPGIGAGPQGKTRIGGTRTGEDDDKCTVSRSGISDACIPHGVIAKRMRVTDYAPARANVAAKLELESNFDGYAICVGWNKPTDDNRFFAAGNPAHPIRLTAGERVQLGPAAPATSDQTWTSVLCTGVSDEAWKSLAPSALQALDPNSAPIVLSSYARLHSDTIQQDTVTISLKPNP